MPRVTFIAFNGTRHDVEVPAGLSLMRADPRALALRARLHAPAAAHPGLAAARWRS